MTPPQCPESSPLPPNMAALVARVREIAEAHKEYSAAIGEAKYAEAERIGHRFRPADAHENWAFSFDWMSGRLFAAAELLAILEGKAE